MTTVNFSDVPMGAKFNYNGIVYIKDRLDKAQEYGTCKVRRQFSASDAVEYDAPATVTKKPAADWRNDPATDKQIEYLVSLGVNIDGMQLTKGQASRIIDAAKGGYLGSLGMFTTSGSN